MNNPMRKGCTVVATAMACVSLAQAEVVVIVNPKSGIASMTATQVADIYLGKDTSFNPFDLPSASASRSEFYTKVAGKDEAQVKAVWARLVFTGKSQPPKEVASSADVVKQVAAGEKAIGYVEKSAVDSSVKAVLTVN
jgi:ABC-type phosphate transport system substrate-binding protein